MSTSRKASVLLVVAALAGCATNSDQSLTAPAQRLDAAGGGVSQSVTGHANMQLPSFGNAVQRFSQSAIRHSDGTVSGEFELKSDQDDGVRLHGEVTCFTIVGNAARLAGELDQSNAEFAPAGTYVLWTVVDNGEGGKAPPDLTTDFIGGVSAATAAAHCNTGFNLGPFLPVMSGNLQVHS